MNMKYPQLKKVIKSVDFENISTKDLIYVCRNSLNRRNSGLNEKDYLELTYEILGILKSKEWRRYEKDIDGNILLTYPVLHGNKECVQYLLENKYNVRDYNHNVSDAICACVSLLGNNILDYFLSIEMNQRYKNDMLAKAYNMLSRVKFDTETRVISTYELFVEKLIDKSDFEKVLEKILVNSNNKSFQHFLIKHPLDLERKAIITKEVIENYLHFKLKSSDIKGKEEILNKYELFAKLKKIPSKEETQKTRKI